MYKIPTFAESRELMIGSHTPFFFLERLIPEIEPATYCFWWKAIVLTYK